MTRSGLRRVALLTGLGFGLPAALIAEPPPAEGPMSEIRADPRRTPVVEVFEQTRLQVVNIAAERIVDQPVWGTRGRRGDLFDEFFGRFHAPQTRRMPVRSLGSGFIAAEGGMVLTNEHVVSRAENIRVILADGHEYHAEIVGAAPDVDLAVLRIDSGDDVLPPPLRFFEGTPWIGETVIAVGNPFGLDHSVSTGVISALDRSFRADHRTFAGVLQTDASINPGNSGGPLLNVHGEVVGVNVAIFQEAQGIGFAIPADVARRVLHELLSNGDIAMSWIGVELQALDARLAAGLGRRSQEGALVARVLPDSPAARAGLEPGDLLVRLDKHRLRTPEDIGAHLNSYPPESRLRFEGLRNSEEWQWPVTVAAYDEQRLDGWLNRVGLQTRRADKAWVITRVEPGSPAADIGFRPGDAIVAIDRIRVQDEGRLARHLLAKRRSSYFLVSLARGRFIRQVGLRLPPPDPSF